jgi:hypothetical protein
MDLNCPDVNNVGIIETMIFVMVIKRKESEKSKITDVLMKQKSEDRYL